ncbi:hypothetical protein GQ457_04G022690 [Hibiscus cannabinus]
MLSTKVLEREGYPFSVDESSVPKHICNSEDVGQPILVDSKQTKSDSFRHFLGVDTSNGSEIQAGIRASMVSAPVFYGFQDVAENQSYATAVTEKDVICTGDVLCPRELLCAHSDEWAVDSLWKLPDGTSIESFAIPLLLEGSFRHIAMNIGKVIQVDYKTDVGDRCWFTRLAIVIGLNKPLLSCIGIDNFVQKIEYEGMTSIYFKCGIYGHFESVYGIEDTEIVEVVLESSPKWDSGKLDTMFGPWMIVETKRRRYKLSEEIAPRSLKSTKVVFGSRSSVLTDMEGEIQYRDVSLRDLMASSVQVRGLPQGNV